MNNEIALASKEQALAKVILEGDLSKLKPEEKVIYYKQVCDSVGLNPLTQPLAFIRFQGKEVLYAGKNCTEQLRDLHGISLKIVDRTKIDDLYVVTAEATNKTGRCDSSTGAVNLKGLVGDALANAVMKAETKAKRRVTLSISGLGFLDESETDSIPGAQKLNVDMETGEILEAKQYVPSAGYQTAHLSEHPMQDRAEKEKVFIQNAAIPIAQVVEKPFVSPFLTKDQVFKLSEIVFKAKLNAKDIYAKYGVASYEQLTNAQAKEIASECEARYVTV